MSEIAVVQGLMDVASKKMESARKQLEEKKVVEKYSSTVAKLVKNT